MCRREKKLEAVHVHHSRNSGQRRGNDTGVPTDAYIRGDEVVRKWFHLEAK